MSKKEWTYSEVTELTKEFMSFEWDNREVQRFNLIQSFTPAIFWHYVSNQFFPLNTYELAQDYGKHFEEKIRTKLCNKEIAQKDLMSLYNLDSFKERVRTSKEKFMTEQLLETSVLPIINDQANTFKVEENDQLEDNKLKNDPNNVD